MYSLSGCPVCFLPCCYKQHDLGMAAGQPLYFAVSLATSVAIATAPPKQSRSRFAHSKRRFLLIPEIGYYFTILHIPAPDGASPRPRLFFSFWHHIGLFVPNYSVILR